MNQLVTLSFYTAPITLPPCSSNLGASVGDGAEGPMVYNTRDITGQFILREIMYWYSFIHFYFYFFTFWEEIMVDMYEVCTYQPEQLSGGSWLGKLQHAHALYEAHSGDHWSCQLVICSGTRLELSGWTSWPCSNSHLLANMFFFPSCVYVQRGEGKCWLASLCMFTWVSGYFFIVVLCLVMLCFGLRYMMASVCVCVCVCVLALSLVASFPVLVGMCKDSQLCPVHWHSSLSGNSLLHSENSFTICHCIWLLFSLTCIHMTVLPHTRRGAKLAGLCCV